ncbi:MAG: T9SS type A sorting domain-containing protein [Bacteroidetes bacterium]|nr:T9SS type A sorting domain-containing protein [Bacteroidota bacterium]
MKQIVIVCLFSLFHFVTHAQKSWDGGAGSNNWGDANNWNPNGLPAATDPVTIGNGFTVILNTNATVASLTVGGGTSGTLTMGNNNTNRTLTVTGNVSVSNGATFNSAGNGGNNLNIGGNLTNSGTFDMNVGAADCDVTFNGSANQTISGTGATTDFNLITINNTGAANDNIVEVLPSNFTAAAGFLTLTRGIIKMSGSYTFTNTFIPASASLVTINADEGIWLNNSNVTVSGQNCDISLSGLLRITSGTFNAGTGADWWFNYNSGAVVTIEGGALNVASGFFGTLSTSTVTYTQSNGTVTVNTSGNTGAFGAVPSFGIEATASVFTMSGGSIVIQLLNDVFTDYINLSTTATVTGGTVQVGNASSPVPASAYWVNSTPPIYNLLVNTTNTPTCELQVNTTVINDVTIGGGLDAAANNVSLTIGHDLINNGTFSQGTGVVTFNGAALQQIAGSNSTTFTNLTINNTAGNTTTGVSLQRAATVTGTLALTSGHITTTSTNLLTMNAGSSVSGANFASRISGGSNNSFVNGPLRKNGNTDFLFPVGKLNAGHHYCGISAPTNLTDAYTAEYKRSSGAALGTVTAVGLNHVSNCENWDLNRVAGTSNVNVTLSWNGSSNCSAAVYVNDLATLTVAHFNGSNWNTHNNNGGTTGTASDGSVTWNSTPNYSTFTLGSTTYATNPLPVKLANIKAYASGEKNRVEWSNLTEADMDAYYVEKSADGYTFQTLASVAARGNTSAREDYTALDNHVMGTTAWYRIRAVNKQGQIYYSLIVRVDRVNKEENKLLIYPNPVTGKQMTVQVFAVRNDKYSVRIINSGGQIVSSQTWNVQAGAASRTLELPAGLPAGMYQLQLSSNSKTMQSTFLIQ